MANVSAPRNQEPLTQNPNGIFFSIGQQQWNKEVWEAINSLMSGSFLTASTASFSLSFTDVPLGSNSSQTASAPGAKVGDFVLLVPSMSGAGLVFNGAVTANDNIIVYAQNYTTDTISTGSISFKALFLRVGG